jgi:hypothetical protein
MTTVPMRPAVPPSVPGTCAPVPHPLRGHGTCAATRTHQPCPAGARAGRLAANAHAHGRACARGGASLSLLDVRALLLLVEVGGAW